MYAHYLASSGHSSRTVALFLQESTRRVDACALAGVYRAPRFICDPFAPRALLLISG